ncbi:phosphatidylinositol 4-phosphate 3-kinase C2 domain-containing subunit alpha-like, partial [Engraulis encrasicolus]|uniref:phosphatidylinositol 4-phosphate 3-kinase C2 domain-containing subunit alpha-like n=1 Tax=Engraulis encrasicolus TaxID=184585 RepID=UPI002FD4FEF4
MAQISSGNGLHAGPRSGSPGVMRPRGGVVGKEEALRMEEEALARLQREKRHTLPATAASASASALSSSPSSSSSSHISTSRSSKKLDGALRAPQLGAPGAAGTSGRAERDLIFFPEADGGRKGGGSERDALKNIDVNKLTNEELEKILLDTSFDTNSKAPRPSSLLGCNLSASYPGGVPHAYSPVPFQQVASSPWTSISSISSVSSNSSALSTPTHPQAPGGGVFPAFPKPVGACVSTFTNGYTPPMSHATFHHLPMPSFQQPAFLPFAPIQVYQPAAVTPEMAKLFDKITSTSEYLRSERSSSMDSDSTPAPPKSLEPAPAPSAPAAEPPAISRFDWLDLDPLSMRRGEQEEGGGAGGGPAGVSGTHRPGASGGNGEVGGGGACAVARDPWDAVLLDEPEGRSKGGPGAGEAPEQVTTPGVSQQRRASTGTPVTRSQSLNISTNHQLNKGSAKVLTKYPTLLDKEAQNLEVVAFCEDIATLRSKFVHGDLVTNPGYVLSPVIPQPSEGGDNSSGVKVSIEISDSQEPVTFTCDGEFIIA